MEGCAARVMLCNYQRNHSLISITPVYMMSILFILFKDNSIRISVSSEAGLFKNRDKTEIYNKRPISLYIRVKTCDSIALIERIPFQIETYRVEIHHDSRLPVDGAHVAHELACGCLRGHGS